VKAELKSRKNLKVIGETSLPFDREVDRSCARESSVQFEIAGREGELIFDNFMHRGVELSV
jgi:hypothetical protein